jgi:hypothetical protein
LSFVHLPFPQAIFFVLSGSLFNQFRINLAFNLHPQATECLGLRQQIAAPEESFFIA